MKLHKWLSVAGKMAWHLNTGATQSWGPEFRFNNLYSKLGILFMTVSPAPRQGRQEDQAEAHWHQPSQENASLGFRGRHCLKGIDGVSENTQCLAENTQCFLLASSGHLSHVEAFQFNLLHSPEHLGSSSYRKSPLIFQVWKALITECCRLRSGSNAHCRSPHFGDFKFKSDSKVNSYL